MISQAVHLLALTYLHMTCEWPICCPRLIHALHITGLNPVRYQHFIQLDHSLIASLVERWCPMTNSFHLLVGEMTITLQDVHVILNIMIDGAPMIGSTMVGEKLR
ncbi:hypothetical protein KFK09_004119 [Dendrobium nobile]|uniref:Aminotransferase-like plant mobile domain-containing protein n=1 Tax=Dendrobium nobile TaxID=94219 RepID=A0A8T3C4H2_DENNO|nr:hypothetical protein KFK09_004119 [Dendrobium nobile]